jgi:Ca2+-binding EF-hand superfamily protein
MMRKRFGLIGTVAFGITAFAPAACTAGDEPTVGIGPIENLQDVAKTARLLFKLADTNNDGQISQKEATDMGNLLAGGFFFRADANGDGVLTRQEAQQARDNLFAQQPLLKLVLDKAKKPENAAQPNAPRTAPARGDKVATAKQLAADPARTIGDLLDTNNDQNIQASEVRQAVQTGVQTLFSVADTNQDGQLSPYELNEAVGTIASSAVQTVFQAADTDHNNELSMNEYEQALKEPAHMLFRVIDADNNNQISLAELQRAEQILLDQVMRLRVPEQPNSLLNQVQSGVNPATRRPQTTAPAPAPAQGTVPGTVTTAPR